MSDLERAIAYAIKNQWCLGCDRYSGPHTFRRWTPGEGHTTETHPGVGPIGALGLCSSCQNAMNGAHP